MGILSITTDVAGQLNDNPRRVKIISTDNLATVTAAGYLNSETLLTNTILPTDVIDLVYSYSTATNSGVYEVFTPAFSSNIITLSLWANAGDVLLPVVSGDFAVFNGTTGQIKDSGLLPSASSQVYVATSPGSLTTNHVLKTSDTHGTIADAGFLASNVMLLNAVNTMAAASQIILDKGTGTESSHAVTINKQSGVITTTSLTTAQFATETITLTNSEIATTSVVIATIMGGTNTTPGVSISATAGSGSSTIVLANNNLSALNGTVIIGFAVF